MTQRYYPIKVALAAALMLATVGCQNNELPGSDDSRQEEEVRLAFRTAAPVVVNGNTRALGDAAMAADTQVGIYFAAKDASDLTGVSDNSANHLYTATADGATTDDAVYWNDYATALDLYAYSPYKATAPLNDAKTGLKWSVDQNQSSFTDANFTDADLLVSNDVRSLSYTANKAAGRSTLTFNHALAKLRINIIDNSAAAGTDGYTTQELTDISTVILKGQKLTGEVVFMGQEAGKTNITLSDGPKDITPKKWATPATGDANQADGQVAVATFEAICLPQTIAANTPIATISVTSAGLTQQYNVTASAGGGYELKQGYNNIINVIITKTGISLGFVVTDWKENISKQPIIIDGVTDAGTPGISGGNLSPNNGDQLKLAYVTPEGKFSNRTVYTYSDTDNSWSSAPLLYWDNITINGFTNKFTAIYDYCLPGTTPEKDYLTGLAQTDYGTPLTVPLTHAMSQISITLKPRKGYNDGNGTDEEKTQAMLALLTTRIVRLQGASSSGPAVKIDGSADITLKTNVSDLIGGKNEGGSDKTFENGKVYTVAPQTLTDKHIIILGLANGNTYTLKLSDIAETNENGNPTGNKLFGDTPGTIAHGQKYAITITVNDTEIALSGTIVPWTELSGSGEMNPDWQ